MDNVYVTDAPLLSVKGVTLKYPLCEKPVLDDISFSLNAGEVCFITGANSSGKSSLLAAIAGLIPSTVEGELTGTILVKSRVPGELRASLCVQNSDVCLFEDVYQEISYPLINASRSQSETEDKVHVIARLLGIEELLNRGMSTLSGGERQKVAIAATLACDKEIILLDEPYEQFDPYSVKRILESLKEYASENNRAILIASRREEYAERVAHRVLRLEGGHLMDITGQGYHYRSAMPSAADNCEAGDGDSSGAPLISFRNVTHIYNGMSGIKGIDILINAGEVTGIMGPNGAGKTTLLKHCIGLLRPQSGSVLYSGEDIKDIPVHRLALRTGMLFQNPDDQIFNERADKEIVWGLTIRGMKKKEAYDKASGILREFGIEEFAGTHPHSLSQSVRQIIALASVLVTEPDILILDEPTRTMDDNLIELTMGIIKRYLKSSGAVVIISHDPPVIWRYTDRCFFMNSGEISAAGRTEELMRDPELLGNCGLLAHPFFDSLVI